MRRRRTLSRGPCIHEALGCARAWDVLWMLALQKTDRLSLSPVISSSMQRVTCILTTSARAPLLVRCNAARARSTIRACDRTAALWRQSSVRYKRQSRLHAQFDPMGICAHDQRNVCTLGALWLPINSMTLCSTATGVHLVSCDHPYDLPIKMLILEWDILRA